MLEMVTIEESSVILSRQKKKKKNGICVFFVFMCHFFLSLMPHCSEPGTAPKYNLGKKY